MASRRAHETADTRERILEAAATLFAQRGFDATSVRDIAAVVGISNPSLYHHFASKSALLDQLLAEPLARAQRAVEEAALLTGTERTRRIIVGLLEALEVHHGVAIAALRHTGVSDNGDHALVAEARPIAYDLLLSEVAAHDADLRVRMLVGAVERVVVELMLTADDGDDFVEQLRARRDAIVDLAMRLVG